MPACDQLPECLSLPAHFRPATKRRPGGQEQAISSTPYVTALLHSRSVNAEFRIGQLDAGQQGKKLVPDPRETPARFGTTLAAGGRRPCTGPEKLKPRTEANSMAAASEKGTTSSAWIVLGGAGHERPPFRRHRVDLPPCPPNDRGSPARTRLKTDRPSPTAPAALSGATAC